MAEYVNNISSNNYFFTLRNMSGSIDVHLVSLQMKFMQEFKHSIWSRQ